MKANARVGLRRGLFVCAVGGLLATPARECIGMTPTNDQCGNAFEVFAGDTQYFCNVGATQDPNNGCSYAEVWFKFNAPCSGVLTVSAPTNFIAAVYSPNIFGSCTCPPGGGTFGGGQLLGCGATATANVVGGRCYYISVGSSHPAIQDCGNLEIELAISAGDVCSDAVPIAEGQTIFCNFGANTNAPSGDCGGMFNDVWFEHVPECSGNLNVSACSHDPFALTRVAVYGPGFGGSSCVNPPFQNGVLLGCADDGTTCSDAPATLTVPVIGGNLYKIRVASTEPSSGIITLSNTVPNDGCLGAVEIGQGDTPFCTLVATESPAENGCAAFADPGPDIWFKHTALCTGTLIVSTCNQANYNTKIAVYQGCGVSPPFFQCNLNTLLGCNDNVFECPGGTSSLAVSVTEGVCYRIRVGGAGDQSGTGTLSLSYAGCTPPEPCPADINGDNTVNVTDLLAVINGWGAGGASDINGDGTTNVTDLLAVINAWGPCP